MTRFSILVSVSLLLAGCDDPMPLDGGPMLDGGPSPGRDGSAPDPDGGATGADAGPDAGPGVDAGPDVDPMGTVSAEVHVDHMGWRPDDHKTVVLLGHAGETVEIRDAHDGTVAGSYTASATTMDEDSGDRVALVDFSDLTTPGDYYAYLPDASLRSYRFTIGERAFDLAGLAAAKSYYYQRCNHDRALPYASDALGDAPGIGGQWVDGTCHTSDTAAPAGPGSPDHGALDLHGGWHDAGDYQKTLWGRGVPELLFAYEMNPGAWRDGQLHIPESGNGVPDLLDEIAWELDFYVRMQRPDGHFMTSIKGRDATVSSPPSASDEARVYFDATAPSGGGWSGGGTTLGEATGNAVLSLAHAAIVFRGHDDTAADRYAAAARSRLELAGERDAQRASGVASPPRPRGRAMDDVAARTIADGFAWSTSGRHARRRRDAERRRDRRGRWHSLADRKRDRLDRERDPRCCGRRRDGRRRVRPGGPLRRHVRRARQQQDWSWDRAGRRAHVRRKPHDGRALRRARWSRRRAEVVEARGAAASTSCSGLNPLDMLYLTTMAAYGASTRSFRVCTTRGSATWPATEYGNATTTAYRPASTSRSTPLPGRRLHLDLRARARHRPRRPELLLQRRLHHPEPRAPVLRVPRLLRRLRLGRRELRASSWRSPAESELGPSTPSCPSS
ncbi:MAG: glycoside hydrolase family 9 protein [Sandaracinaceae bacterium]